MKKCKHEYEGTFLCVDMCKKCGDVLLPSIEIDYEKILENEDKDKELKDILENTYSCLEDIFIDASEAKIKFNRIKKELGDK